MVVKNNFNSHDKTHSIIWSAGAISIEIPQGSAPEFESWYKMLNPWNTPLNPWLHNVWAREFKCNWNVSIVIYFLYKKQNMNN